MYYYFVCVQWEISHLNCQNRPRTLHKSNHSPLSSKFKVFYVLRRILVGFRDPLYLWAIYFTHVHTHFDTHKHTQSTVNNMLIKNVFPINHLTTPWDQSPAEQSKNRSALWSRVLVDSAPAIGRSSERCSC